MSARFHRRFAFAPGAFEHHAARSGRAVGPLLWQADGSLLAHVDGASGTADQTGAWWQLSADRRSMTALPPAQAPATVTSAERQQHGPRRDGARRRWPATCVRPRPRTAAPRGATMSAVRSAAIAPVTPDGHTLAVGTAGGYLVLLHKGSGTDPYLDSNSRYAVRPGASTYWGDAGAAGLVAARFTLLF